MGSGWDGTSQNLASLFIEVLGRGGEPPEPREESHYGGDEWEPDENHDRNATGEGTGDRCSTILEATLLLYENAKEPVRWLPGQHQEPILPP